MNRDNLQYWSISCGTWLETQVRLSVFYIPFALILIFKSPNYKIGLIVAAFFLISTVLHEFGHVFAARQTGGSGNEILIWPFGGLAFVRPIDSFTSRFVTAAAGPFVNLLLCLATLWPVWRGGLFPEALYPLSVPSLALSGSSLVPDLLVLLFCVNWKLFLVNMLPVYPLDGGQMVQAALRARYGAETAMEWSIRVGFLAAAVVVSAGLFFYESPWLVFIGAFLFILNMTEVMQSRPADNFDDSFMGYDFSQGYTSLEKNRETKPVRRPGLIERWRERRRVEKQRRIQVQAEQEQEQLDALLQKVHTQGMDSLSDAERRKLQHMSERLRGRTKPDK